MYFHSRLQAGRMLAAQLVPKYRYENCIVVVLNDGGVMVGAQIAAQLHCIITMLLSEEIDLPREPLAFGGITSEGSLVYNHAYSSGDIDEFSTEYRGMIEEQKITKLHELNKLLGSNGLIKREWLKGHNVILTADGMKDGFMLDMALQCLKPMQIDRLIVAVPLASVETVDQLHVAVDEIYCLDVPVEYFDTNHYYDKQDIPDHEAVVSIIQQIVLHWK